MPTSHFSTISPLLKIILDLNERHELRKILDIGVGFGKWGILLDEFLRNFKRDPITGERALGSRLRIFGCEPHKPYETYLWAAYDVFYCNKALEILHVLKGDFDLILLFDVLEHHTKQKGKELLKLCLEKSKYTLICTPKDAYIGKQTHLYGNELEMHHSQWDERDFFYLECSKTRYEHDRALIILLER